jgi:lycopene cyclase domain-containing protein
LDYLTIIVLAFLGPFVLSFDSRVHFYKKWRPLAASMLVVAPIYIIWDAVATDRGDWWFNEEYTSGIHILGLPLAEVLFFLVVPYACIFIYEVLIYYLGDKELPFNRWAYVLAAILLLVLAVVFIDQYYTATVLVFTAAFLYIAAVLYPAILKARAYWQYVLMSLVPFFIVNYLLTSIPIVLYSDEAIWGVKITTIPAEDLIYNFSMLSFYLLVYVYFKRRWGVDADNEGVPMEVATGRGLAEVE